MKKSILLFVLFLLVIPLTLASQNCNPPALGVWNLEGDVICDSTLNIDNLDINCAPEPVGCQGSTCDVDRVRYSITLNSPSTITNSNLYNCGVDKQDFTANAQLTFTGNTMTDSVPLTLKGSNNIITGNTIKKTIPLERSLFGRPSQALVLEDSTGNLIQDNNFSEIGKGTIRDEDGKKLKPGLFTTAVQLKNSEAQVIGNTFEDANFGLNINGYFTTPSSVINNEFTDLGVAGLLVTDQDSIQISHNNFTNIGAVGLGLQNVDFADNITSNNFVNTPATSSCDPIEYQGALVKPSSIVIADSQSTIITGATITSSNCNAVSVGNSAVNLTNVNFGNNDIETFSSSTVKLQDPTSFNAGNLIVNDALSRIYVQWLVDIAVKDSSTLELLDLANVDGYKNEVDLEFQTITHSLIEDYPVTEYYVDNLGTNDYNNYLIEAYKDGYETNSTIESVTMPDQLVEILLDEEVNVAPVAEFSVEGYYDFMIGVSNTNYGFDATESYDPDNNITNREMINGVTLYQFFFGNGDSYEEAALSTPDGTFDGKTDYSYPSPGYYTVTLRVWDQDLSYHEDTLDIWISS